jgi:hypothetical protein
LAKARPCTATSPLLLDLDCLTHKATSAMRLMSNRSMLRIPFASWLFFFGNNRWLYFSLIAVVVVVFTAFFVRFAPWLWLTVCSSSSC